MASHFAIDSINTSRVVPGGFRVWLAGYQGDFQFDSAFPQVLDVGANTPVPGTIYTANTNGSISLTKNNNFTSTNRQLRRSPTPPPIEDRPIAWLQT